MMTGWQVIAVLVQLYILSRIEAVGSNADKVTVKTKNVKGWVGAGMCFAAPSERDAERLR